MYDVIFIGGGLNYAGAVVLAKAGKKVALIEKDLNHIGGTCLNNGCIPSKNLLHRTKALLETKEDIFSEPAKIDFKKLHKKVDERLAKNRAGIKKQCEVSGIDLIEGEGFITDNGVEVNGKTLTAEYYIIGTGARARIPKGIEYDGKRIITSDEALKLNPPKEISIYGRGAIAIEMAGLFAVNGSKVNLIFRHEKISDKFDEDITAKMEKQLKELGVNFITNTTINSAVVKGNEVVINDNFKTPYLLVATGRIPNVEVVKTDKIKVDKKGIVTDEYFETTLKNIFAIGDCNGKLQLAHAARAEALNVVDNILGKKWILNLNNIPKFIYSLPLQYSSVGAKSENISKFPLSRLGIAGSVYGSEDGIIVLYTDEENFIIGAEILAPNAEELIGIIATAIESEIDVKTFEKVVFPHPTFSEGIDRALRRFK